MSVGKLNLQASEACSGKAAGYIGLLYHQLGRMTVCTPVVLPSSKAAKAREPAAWIHLSQVEAGEALGGEIKTNKLIALAVTRVCMQSKHLNNEHTPANNLRTERVGAFAIVKSRVVEEIVPPKKYFDLHVDEWGIGSVDRRRGMPPIKPLIVLPVTPDEAQERQYVAAIPSLATVRGLDKQPYIALHDSTTPDPERIVHIEEL